MNKYTTLAAAVLLLSSASAFAATWTSEAELGIIVTDGNSETQNTNAKVSATRDTDKWKQAGALAALGSSNTSTDAAGNKIDSTTGEKYSANAKVDYKLNDADFLFATADYIDDRFSGFDFQATISAGYGRVLLNNDKQSLSAEIGPGKRYIKVTGSESDDESILHMAAKYAYTFNEQAKFTQSLIIDAGDDVTISESISALQAQVSGKLAMKASFTVRDSSKVPPTTEERDTITALTLVYSLK